MKCFLIFLLIGITHAEQHTLYQCAKFLIGEHKHCGYNKISENKTIITNNISHLNCNYRLDTIWNTGPKCSQKINIKYLIEYTVIEEDIPQLSKKLSDLIKLIV